MCWWPLAGRAVDVPASCEGGRHPCFQFRKQICMISNCLMLPSTPPFTHSPYNNTSHDISPHLCPVTNVFSRPTSQVKKTVAQRGQVACPQTHGWEMARAIAVTSSAATLTSHILVSTKAAQTLPSSKPSHGSHLLQSQSKGLT